MSIQMEYKDIPQIRKKLLQKQDGVCAICKRVPHNPVLDHSHTKRVKGTGLVRGTLCSNCNVFLAKIENNASRYGIKQRDLASILKNTADYIGKIHHPYRHPTEKPKRKTLMKSSYNALKSKVGGSLPSYPKSGKLTLELEAWYTAFKLEPQFYKEN